VLRVEPHAPAYPTARHGEVPLVDAVATHDPDRGEVTLFAVNRSTAEPVRLAVDARALVTGADPEPRVLECTSLHEPDRYRATTAAEPDAVVPRRNPTARVDSGEGEVVLPAVSWTVLRLRA
jgi:alpha-N-arabinofuranosidase